MSRVLVCGDREWQDDAIIHAVLTGLYAEHSVGWLVAHVTPFCVIEGGARGADRAAGWWAGCSPLHGPPSDHAEYDERQCPCDHERYPADWEKHGKAAGPIRNQQMLTEGKPDLVLAFHDDLASSKGTRDMVMRATKAGIPTYVIGRAGRGDLTETR